LPPPQNFPPVHGPQSAVRTMPHLSAAVTLPQALTSRVQKSVLVSVHPQTFGVPPPPQVTPVPEQAPHEAVEDDVLGLAGKPDDPHAFDDEIAVGQHVGHEDGGARGEGLGVADVATTRVAGAAGGLGAG
jgi:hypothetical protein